MSKKTKSIYLTHLVAIFDILRAGKAVLCCFPLSPLKIGVGFEPHLTHLVLVLISHRKITDFSLASGQSSALLFPLSPLKIGVGFEPKEIINTVRTTVLIP